MALSLPNPGQHPWAAALNAALEQLDEQTVVDGAVVGDDLILTRNDGTTVNAGDVRGPVGAPGGSDAAFAGFVSDPETLTGQALETVIGGAVAATGAPVAEDGNEYVFLAGVIRNEGTGWEFLPEETNHRPINFTSVETIDDANGLYGYIRVNYDVVGSGGMTVVMLAIPDETLARNGFTLGTSVTQTYTDIRISQSLAAVSDYLYWDAATSAWVSQGGVYTVESFSGGVLTLSHRTIDLAGQYDVRITPRGPGLKYLVSSQTSPFGAAGIKVDVRDDSPLVSDYIRWNGSAWVSESGTYTFAFDAATGVLTLTHPAIPNRATARYSITPRSNDRLAVADLNSGFASQTTLKIKFTDYAGATILTPDTGCRALVQHGGPSGQLVATGAADMQVAIGHGGGQVQWKPSALDTTEFPGSNIWLFGIMGRG